MEDFHGKPYEDDKPVRYNSNLISTIGVYLIGFACGGLSTLFIQWLI